MLLEQFVELIKCHWLHEDFLHATLDALVNQVLRWITGRQSDNVRCLAISFFARVYYQTRGQESVHHRHIAVHEYNLVRHWQLWPIVVNEACANVLLL